MDIRGMAATAKRYQEYADRVRKEYAEKVGHEESEQAVEEVGEGRRSQPEDASQA